MLILIMILLMTGNAMAGQVDIRNEDVLKLYKQEGFVAPKKYTPSPKKHHYKLVSKKEMNKEAWEFAKEHAKMEETNWYLEEAVWSSGYDEDCLDLLDTAIKQSYEGCMLTTKLEPTIYPITGTDLDKKVQMKKHLEQRQALKSHICKNQMLGAKYHHQETICRFSHDRKWYVQANELAKRKVYKYINIYIKKQAIAWRGLPYPTNTYHNIDGGHLESTKDRIPTKSFDRFYKESPVHLAGNIRNYAYDNGEPFRKEYEKQQYEKKWGSSKIIPDSEIY